MDFLPALGRFGGSRSYERVLRFFQLGAVHDLALERLGPLGRQRVLDMGCGPGKQVQRLQAGYREAFVVGLDADLAALSSFRPSFETIAPHVCGMAQSLPFADHSFDAVTTTFLLHHLSPRQKCAGLAEAHRVLRPGGALLVVDWTKPRRWLSALGFTLVRLTDGFERTADHAGGRLSEIIREAGFESPDEVEQLDTMLGTVGCFRCRRPGRESL